MSVGLTIIHYTLMLISNFIQFLSFVLKDGKYFRMFSETRGSAKTLISTIAIVNIGCCCRRSGQVSAPT